MSTLLLDLIAHMRWADRLVADALDPTRESRSSPSLRSGSGRQHNADPVSVFAHIAAVEHLWYSRIKATTPQCAVWPDLTVTESRAIAEQHADLFEKLVAGSGDVGLERVVSYRNSAGRDFRNSVRDIVTQVTMHGSYHRGQIARLIRAAGGEPPYTDYIQFVRRDQST